MSRQKVTLRYKINGRIAEVTAFDTVGVEDCMDVLSRAALHRIMTGEDWTDPIPREIKDFILKNALFI